MLFGRRSQRSKGSQSAGKVCGHCGADVPRGRASCGACGASESDGWSDEANEYLETPEEGFDYDEFVAAEFGAPPGGTPVRWSNIVIWVLIASLAAAILLPLVL